MAQRTLTPRQQRFVEEYLIDLNATQAAIRAGYSVRYADRIGPSLLGKTSVADAIAEAIEKRSRRTTVTQDQVIRELARVGFVDARRLITWGPNGVTLKDSTRLSDDEAACVIEASQTTTAAGGQLRIKLADKMKALELLGRHLGMFVDKQEVSGPDGKPIQHEHIGTSNRIEQLTASFAAVADRTGQGGDPGNDSGEPVDPA